MGKTTTKSKTPTKSVQKEAGKTDKIIEDGTVTNVPEGEGEERAKDGGWINGREVTKEEFEKTTAG